jgi:hypothetical protein
MNDTPLWDRFPAVEAHVSQRRLHLGDAAPETGDLPPPVGNADTGPPRSSFELAWSDRGLGLDVLLYEGTGEQAGQVWASALSPDVGLAGRTAKVCVGSVAEAHQFLCVNVVLAATPTGAQGRALVGTLAELSAELGGRVMLSAGLV